MTSRMLFELPLTNRIYLFKSAEYLTASETVSIFNWDLKSIYENRKNIFKEKYKFWNKLKDVDWF
jgi:hypothetical protein